MNYEPGMCRIKHQLFCIRNQFSIYQTTFLRKYLPFFHCPVKNCSKFTIISCACDFLNFICITFTVNGSRDQR